MRRTASLAVALLLAGCAGAPRGPAPTATGSSPVDEPVAAANPAIDGVSLPTDRTIADNVAVSPSLGRFTRALLATGLYARLREAGPFTVFAPTDEAWGRLQPGTADILLKPENSATLDKLLRLHVAAGTLSGAALARRVAAGGGRAVLPTLAGEPLTVTLTQGIVTLSDEGGNRSYVAIADVRNANGMLHVVNGVLVPRV